MTTKRRATIEDLYREPGKAEIVNGEIVRFPMAGCLPSLATGEILFSLWHYAKTKRQGRAVGPNAGYHVYLPHREAFCPDVSYYVGPDVGMKFFEGAPVFAAEVRSESDYGEAAERDMAQKRADYFAAGTLVVWDVNLLNEEVVRKYTPDKPEQPTVFRRGEIADAEPAVPGWQMPVDELFA